MKSKKIVIAILSVCFTITLLSSCHRSTCPTFGKTIEDARMEVRV